MEDLEFGPVEMVLAAFEGERPDPGVIAAIAELVEAGTIRLIDLVHVSRDQDGAIRFAEIDEAGIELGEIELAAAGLAAQEDVEELGADLPPGTSAVLLVVELLWAKRLASRVAAAGGFVVDSVRIPAPVVNAAVAEAVGA
ncbi:DUF6325 family protein [Microbacterium timonense]|jgi:uncharacterized membrane protein|uniref:DUF6325 family protein n=1 Tax=Microbacterium timonense TaxID=2086576 RepID=UPI000D0EE878|nr:DUF6325 family protein [Microbacterium timonense]